MSDTIENFYKIGVWYSFTLNPVDKHQYFGSVNRVRLFRSYMYEQLLAFKPSYRFHIEVSEPRGMKTQGYNGPRLHLHGKVMFKNLKVLGWFLLIGYYKLLRFTSVDIDSIQSIDVWDKYCMKQHLIKNNMLSNYDIM